MAANSGFLKVCSYIYIGLSVWVAANIFILGVIRVGDAQLNVLGEIPTTRMAKMYSSCSCFALVEAVVANLK